MSSSWWRKDQAFECTLERTSGHSGLWVKTKVTWTYRNQNVRITMVSKYITASNEANQVGLPARHDVIVTSGLELDVIRRRKRRRNQTQFEKIIAITRKNTFHLMVKTELRGGMEWRPTFWPLHDPCHCNRLFRIRSETLHPQTWFVVSGIQDKCNPGTFSFLDFCEQKKFHN